MTDLLQVVPTRLVQAVRNKLLRASCHHFVNNLLRADDIRLVETSLLYRHQPCNKVITACVILVTTTGNKQCENILISL